MRPLRKRIRDRIVRGLVRAAMFAVGWMPRLSLGPSARLAEFLGRPFWSKHLRVGRENLARAFPGRSPSEREKILRRSVASLILSAFELFRLRARGEDSLPLLAEFEGKESLEACLASGRGTLHVTAHLGNWELLVVLFARLGYKPQAVWQRLKDPGLDRILREFHEARGIGGLIRGDSALGAFRVLARGGVLGILADMDTDVESAEVPFFGRPVRAPVGPVRLARRAGAALFPTFIFRRPDGRHRIRVFPEIDLTAPDETRAVAAYTRAIEDAVREEPEQWAWVTDRWKVKE
jgi:KDO2-lipid IV(A) lauroyltransferase